MGTSTANGERGERPHRAAATATTTCTPRALRSSRVTSGGATPPSGRTPRPSSTVFVAAPPDRQCVGPEEGAAARDEQHEVDGRPTTRQGRSGTTAAASSDRPRRRRSPTRDPHEVAARPAAVGCAIASSSVLVRRSASGLATAADLGQPGGQRRRRRTRDRPGARRPRPCARQRSGSSSSAAERGGHGDRVAGSADDQTGLAVDHRLGGAAAVARDLRDAAGGRLEEHDAEALLLEAAPTGCGTAWRTRRRSRRARAGRRRAPGRGSGPAPRRRRPAARAGRGRGRCRRWRRPGRVASGASRAAASMRTSKPLRGTSRLSRPRARRRRAARSGARAWPAARRRAGRNRSVSTPGGTTVTGSGRPAARSASAAG